MKLTKKQLISAVIVTVLAGGIGLTSVASVSAQQGNGGDMVDSLASRIATKFNINKDEVRTEIEAQHKENHQAREAKMKQKREEHLQKLADEGKITADQKKAIIAKQDELHNKMEELRNNGKTKEENKDAAKAIHEELKTWAKSQNINLDDIHPELKGKGSRGMHRGKMMGGREDGPQDSQNQDGPEDNQNQ
jgi:outer membrane murein-binding lipoprotein Lpp